MGTHTHVISTRGSHTTHRNYYRLLFIQLFDRSPYLFRSVGIATTRIDAQNYSLHLTVVGEFLQVLNHLGAYNLLLRAIDARSLHSHDGTLAVVDGNFFSHQVRVVYCHINVVIVYLVDGFVCLQT